MLRLATILLAGTASLLPAQTLAWKIPERGAATYDRSCQRTVTVIEPAARIYTAEQKRRLASLASRLAHAEREMYEPDRELDRAQAEWEVETAAGLRELGESGAVLAAVSMAGWQVLGTMSAADAGKVFATEFGTEGGVDLGRKYEGGKLGWRSEPRFGLPWIAFSPRIIAATPARADQIASAVETAPVQPSVSPLVVIRVSTCFAMRL